MEEKKIRTAIVGATGYAGAELVRLLLTHPSTEIVGLSSVSFAGEEIAAVYPLQEFPHADIDRCGYRYRRRGCGVRFPAAWTE